MEKKEEIHVLPDTNVMLHFAFFDFPWRKELNAKRVVIHVSLSVLSELGRLKDAGEPKSLRKRAESRIRKLSNLSEQSPPVVLGENTEIVFEDRPGDCSIHPDLNEKFGDDQLIASALKIQGQLGAEVVVLTADLALKIQVRRFGVPVFAPNEKYRQKITDPDEKKKQQLEAELQRIRNHRPKLDICFSGGDKLLKVRAFTVEGRRKKADAVSKKHVEREKEKLPYRVFKPAKEGVFSIENALIPEEKVDSYNKALDSYFPKAGRWIQKATYVKTGIVDIDLEVINRGEVPAQSVTVLLHFPDGFELTKESNLDQYFEEMPRSPSDPGKLGNFSAVMASIQNSPAHLGPPREARRSPSSISIKKTNSYDVEYTYERIRQGMSVSIDKLCAAFEGDSKSFAISYKLICDNCPEISEGQLNVAFE